MTVNQRSARAAILYFVLHLMNEVICYFMLYRIFKDPEFIVMVAMIYNCVAFVPQFFWGALRDLIEKVKPGLFAVPFLLSLFHTSFVLFEEV